MSTNNDGSKYVYMALGFGTFIIFCSFITDFKMLDFLYLSAIFYIFVRYRIACRKEKKNLE